MTPHIREHVFFSYSHKDKKWLDKLRTMLKPLEDRGLIKAWSDVQIEPGAKWKQEIDKALASAKVAVLLVTSDFLASDFIAKHELPPLLEAAEKDGLTILWIAVRPSLYMETEIASYQAVNDPAKPLVLLSRPEQENELVRICQRIKEKANLA